MSKSGFPAAARGDCPTAAEQGQFYPLALYVLICLLFGILGSVAGPCRNFLPHRQMRRRRSDYVFVAVALVVAAVLVLWAFFG
jgi:uncharacterized membrane protein YidH (DUF202 family)